MDTNIMLWQAVIFGPDDTPWEGGTFKLILEFTEDYPNRAPSVRFLTKMFHPNIYNDGQICLDILQNQWSPIYDISAILTSIQSLLCDPNPASPANSEASRLYNENRREYNRRVREIVEQSWVDDAWSVIPEGSFKAITCQKAKFPQFFALFKLELWKHQLRDWRWCMQLLLFKYPQTEDKVSCLIHVQ